MTYVETDDLRFFPVTIVEQGTANPREIFLDELSLRAAAVLGDEVTQFGLTIREITLNDAQIYNPNDLSITACELVLTQFIVDQTILHLLL